MYTAPATAAMLAAPVTCRDTQTDRVYRGGQPQVKLTEVIVRLSHKL